jgi:hypothetical protein
MAKLINVQRATQKLRGECVAKYPNSFMLGLFAAADELAKIPPVDAVEVVRCNDCKHFVQGEPYDPCECMKWMVKFGVAYTTPDGYCHKGERKDND